MFIARFHVTMLHAVLLASLTSAVTGCLSSLSPAPLHVAHAPPPAAPARCEATAPLPALDLAAFAPTLSGALSLVDARGDARLSAAGGVLPAWSPDSSLVALTDGGTVTVWRTADGAFVDRIACPGKELGANVILMSPDLRWVVVSGFQRDIHNDHPATCIVDRSSHTARSVAGQITRPTFDPAGRVIIGQDRTIDLATGAIKTHAPRPAPATLPAWGVPPTVHMDTEGAEVFVMSHNGRYLAGWTSLRAVLLVAGGTGKAPRRSPPPEPPPFLAVWDLTTGKRLWRDAQRCCFAWQFSADDRFLEAVSRASEELLRVSTGEVIKFPGGLLPMAPDGEHLVLYGSRGLELWATDPPRPVIVPARPRQVVARSADGAVRAALEDHRLVIERDGRCVALGGRRHHDPVAFSPDGQYLYAGIGGQGEHSKSFFELWRTDKGALVTSLEADGPADVYLMPAAGRMGFGVHGGVRLFDALRGQPLAVAEAPRVSQSSPTPNGTSWGVRDHDGERPDAFTGPVSATASGRFLVGQSSLGTSPVAIWDLTDRRGVRDLPQVSLRDSIDPVVLSPDERFIAAGMRNGVVSLWSRDGRAIPVAAKHAWWVEVLAFSPDGERLASAGKDGVVHVIDTATGAIAGDVSLAADRARHLWWSADSARLVIDTGRRFEITVARGSR